MKIILLVFFIFLSTLSFSQVAHVFNLNSENYNLTFSKNSNNYEFSLSKTGKANTAIFTLPKLDITTFTNAINDKLKILNGEDFQNNQNISNKINEVFYIVVANIDVIDSLNYAPLAGELKINDEINLYRDSSNKSKKLSGIKFKILNVQIVFQQGFIQDVIVDGKIIKDSKSESDKQLKLEEFEDVDIKFSNYYGIGFSSKKNIRNLIKINLYPNQKKDVVKRFEFYKKKFDNDSSSNKGTWVNLYETNEIHIKLGEVIESYDFRNELYTTDFSPGNIKITIEGGKSTTLYKDKTFKILESRVFSDFLGFNADNPNGLIQFEVEKQFNFNTTRYKFLTYRIRTGIGYFEYLKLNGGITKIEENNRFLLPEIHDEQATSFSSNPILINKRYTTPIDVVNHQNWNIGISLNALFFDIPLIKSQLHINGNFRFAQTKVQDSLRSLNPDLTINSKSKEFNLGYWQFYPETIWHILPETRYGFYASWRPKYFYSITDGIEFRGMQNQLTGIRRDNISNWINEFELLGYLYVNEEKQNGKLFVRWRLNSEMAYSKNNFSQFQVGYSFYILGRGKQN